MKRILILCFVAVIAFASAAHASVETYDGTNLYGTYSGALTYTNVLTGVAEPSQDFQITIGNDASLQNLEGNNYYLYVPELIAGPSDDWQVDWEDSNDRSNAYIAHMENDHFLGFTNANHQAFSASLLFAKDFSSFFFTNVITQADASGMLIRATTGNMNATPIPGAALLLGSGLLGLVGLRRKMES
ncbi:hypothetical protein [Pseudodesulfovibrio sp. zrk46]|uniref:hypothetical protein n=1 Tax=Pseudodesulfovibrio sp. zrk46 TaxID=2725288 RepID=UPI00144990D7|nr:hypothetical protein [Pseudodesulfovibrio sp. zrk46]QJB55369.1 hypothetical protein HFN16_02715 [Pseudodesulfovibrio sp. zrk46]